MPSTIQLKPINADTYIVGGGILGLLTAWYLAESGYRAVIFDRIAIGKESSWAGGGILSPLYPDRYPRLFPLVDLSASQYPSLCKEIRGLTGIDPEYDRSKLIVLDEIVSPDAPQGPRGARLTVSDLSEIEPALAPPAAGATVYDSARIRNPRFVRALKNALLQKGVRFHENQQVLRITVQKNGRVDSLITENGALPVTRCVIEAGAWTDQLLRPTGITLGIRPIKGQMLAIGAKPGLIANVIVDAYKYLIPRRDGLVLVGSTLEDVGFDKDTTKQAGDELLRVATRLVPQLGNYSVQQHWAGLRPGSPDDAPFIGEHPDIKGLFVCAGHYRNGFATGPASAKLLVDMMLERSPLIDPRPFSLSRLREAGPSIGLK